jgi:predicted nucleic acid-binding protein
LDTELATKAADYARIHALAMADSIIYATAMEAGADVLACDAHFASLPNVVYFAKTAS